MGGCSLHILADTVSATESGHLNISLNIPLNVVSEHALSLTKALSGDVNLCYSDVLYDGEESDISASMPGLMSVARSHCQHLGEHNEIEKDLKVNINFDIDTF